MQVLASLTLERGGHESIQLRKSLINMLNKTEKRKLCLLLLNMDKMEQSKKHQSIHVGQIQLLLTSLEKELAFLEPLLLFVFLNQQLQSRLKSWVLRTSQKSVRICQRFGHDLTGH